MLPTVRLLLELSGVPSSSASSGPIGLHLLRSPLIGKLRRYNSPSSGMVTLLQSAAASPQADGIFLRTSRRATIRPLMVPRTRACRVVTPEIREDRGIRI